MSRCFGTAIDDEIQTCDNEQSEKHDSVERPHRRLIVKTETSSAIGRAPNGAKTNKYQICDASLKNDIKIKNGTKSSQSSDEQAGWG